MDGKCNIYPISKFFAVLKLDRWTIYIPKGILSTRWKKKKISKLKDHSHRLRTVRSKWIEMIRRPLDYQPLPHHRVCSRHFSSSDFRIPELFPWNNYKENIPTRATGILKRQNWISSEHTETGDYTYSIWLRPMIYIVCHHSTNWVKGDLH